MSDDNGSASFLAPPQVALDGSGSGRDYSYKRSASATTSGRGEHRRRRRPWKKLLWVKQDYPDNYTDVTFLDSLQRNVNVRAYDFWPLVSDSTVIAQHLSSIVIFITAFIAISEDRANPGLIAGVSTLFTILAWLVWDEWTEKEETLARFTTPMVQAEIAEELGKDRPTTNDNTISPVLMVHSATTTGSSSAKGNSAKQRNKPRSRSSRTPSPNPKGTKDDLNITSAGSSELLHPKLEPTNTTTPTSSKPPLPSTVKSFPLPAPPPPIPRSHRRLSTLKSAVLIYSTLLGLSPILKSLTESTMEDSIWALSSWLFLINVFCFDYGLSKTEIGSGNEATKRPLSSHGLDKQPNDPASLDGSVTSGTGQAGANALSKKLPTSLSTSTAMAASVVLASRLSSTSAVFYLLLFSIQIFGLFPLFRRRLRYLSLPFHVLLTIVLILTAAFALWQVLSYQWAVIWLCVIVFGLGGAAWWLMHLQKYKNEIQGPWDPAKPLLRNR